MLGPGGSRITARGGRKERGERRDCFRRFTAAALRCDILIKKEKN